MTQDELVALLAEAEHAAPDGGPWETVLAAALLSTLDELEGEGYSRSQPADLILAEYQAAVARHEAGG